MADYQGRSNHTLDDKGRLILPKRILDQVAPTDREFTLTAGPEGCLWLMDNEGWHSVEKSAGTAILATKQQRSMRRIFLGHAEKVTPDRSNRISIAEGLRQYAGFGDSGSNEVVLVGTGCNFEIWSKKRWDSAVAEALASYEFSDNDLVGAMTPSPS